MPELSCRHPPTPLRQRHRGGHHPGPQDQDQWMGNWQRAGRHVRKPPAVCLFDACLLPENTRCLRGTYRGEGSTWLGTQSTGERVSPSCLGNRWCCSRKSMCASAYALRYLELATMVSDTDAQRQVDLPLSHSPSGIDTCNCNRWSLLSNTKGQKRKRAMTTRRGEIQGKLPG